MTREWTEHRVQLKSQQTAISQRPPQKCAAGTAAPLKVRKPQQNVGVPVAPRKPTRTTKYRFRWGGRSGSPTGMDSQKQRDQTCASSSKSGVRGSASRSGDGAGGIYISGIYIGGTYIGDIYFGIIYISGIKSGGRYVGSIYVGGTYIGGIYIRGI